MNTRLLVPAAALALLAACSGDEGAQTPTDTTDAASDAATSDTGDDATANLDTSSEDAGDNTQTDADAGDRSGSGGPFAELEAAGLNRYLGAAQPTSSSELDGASVWEFDPADGPMCIYGQPFRVSSRATGSRDLLIFLQGGGACWEDFCFAVDSAPPGVPPLDVLDLDHPSNPFIAWNVVYVPYCDGSLFAGDTDIDDNGDGTIDRYHRGLRNLSAALDVAREQFPDVDRVMIAGSSGGGYGTLVSAPLVRMVWPEVELLVFNDAGVGLGKPGEPDFIEGIVEEWNIRWAVPASCETCLSSSHLTPLITWALDRDPNLRVAAFSSTRDSIIGSLFLQIGGPAFETALREQIELVRAAHPDRFAAFIIPGGTHTTLLGDLSGFLGPDAEDSPLGSSLDIGSIDTSELNGLTVAAWIGQMINNDPAWTSHIAPAE